MRFLKGCLTILILWGAAVQAEEYILARLVVETAIMLPNRVSSHHDLEVNAYVASVDTADFVRYQVENRQWSTNGGPGEEVGFVEDFAVSGLDELTAYWFWVEFHDLTTDERVLSPRLYFETESFDNLQPPSEDSMGMYFDGFKAGVVGYEISELPPPPTGKIVVMPYSVYLELTIEDLTPVSWGLFKAVVTGY